MIDVEEQLRSLPEHCPIAPSPIEAVRERSVRHRRRRRATAIGLVILLVLAGTALVVTHRASSTLRTVAPPVTDPQNDSTSASWLAVGNDAKASGAVQFQPGLPRLCDPVTIRANGTYVLKAGPVPASFNPSAIAMSVPPDVAQSFMLQVVGPFAVSTSNGSSFITATVKVSNFKKPYVGLRCWFT